LTPESYPTQYDAEADVIIVGGGGAGLAAAIEAADHGAEVIVLEKQAGPYESSTAISSGAIAFAGTSFQRNLGVIDSDDSLYRDLRETGQWKNNESVVRAYVNHQLDRKPHLLAWVHALRLSRPQTPLEGYPPPWLLQRSP